MDSSMGIHRVEYVFESAASVSIYASVLTSFCIFIVKVIAINLLLPLHPNGVAATALNATCTAATIA